MNQEANQKDNQELPEEERLKFLKREEVQTMEKDIARLREGEAQKERERITELKPEEEVKVEKAKEIEREETPPPLMPKVPEKPKALALKKILIRTLIIGVLFLILGYLVWSFIPMEGEGPAEEPSQTEEKPQEKPPEVTPPSSLITVQKTETLEIASLEELPNSLAQVLEKELENNTFNRILIKKDGVFLGLEEFLEGFEVKIPEGLLSKLENDFTLFVYPSEGFNRLGFVAKIQGEDLVGLMSAWEESLEQDTEKLLTALGKEGPALVPYFKSTNFTNETNFRFLTFSKQDFGICYAVTDNYFFFATSFAGMRAAIRATELKELENKLGQLFIIGIEGKEVTSEIKELFRKYHPGGILLLSKNIESPVQLKELTQDLQSLSLQETGLPLFVAVDQEGGLISRIEFLEEKTGQSEIETPDQALIIGKKRGEELKELGVNLNLAPLLDEIKEGDFLFNRSFQKTPVETGSLAKSLIEGQKEAGILTAIKHFPGYGGIDFNPEGKLAEKETVPEISQFKEAMESNPELVMTANVIYKNLDETLPFTFSSNAILFLKNNLGGNVLILSDDLAQNYLLEKFSLKDILKKPIQAGVDLLIFSGWQIEVSKGLEEFFASFRQGELSESQLEAAISRIIQLKENL